MDIANPFHAQLVEDVHEAAERRGYDLVLSTVTRGRDERRAVETLLDSRCEALVLLGPQAPPEHLAALDRQLPVVALGRPVPSAVVDVVRAADDEGVALAVDHLAGLGHRRITYVDGGNGRCRRCAAAATSAPCARTGSTTRPGDHGRQHRGGRRPGGARRARRRPLADRGPRLQRPRGDGPARRARSGARRRPRHLSVVGYDDSPFSRLAHVDLTTVSQNTPELTEHAVAALVERLDGGRAAHGGRGRPQLQVRGTTGPPPG